MVLLGVNYVMPGKEKTKYYDKRDMEEKILEIISENYFEEIPKEIATLFNLFIEWKDNNVGLPNRSGKYLYGEDHFDIDELFVYWLRTINKK